MSIIKGLFIGLKNLKVVPFNRMTPELHDELGSNLAKVMMVAKMSNAKLTKAQREYIVNQAKQLQEFEDRYITGIKDKSGNVIKSDEGIKNTESAKIFNLQGEKLDPSKPIVGGSQSGKKINPETFRRLAERGPQLIKQRIADKKINEIDEVSKRIDSGVAATVEKILNMKPTDAMKEANLIIGRKGPYKNLSQEDAKTILQDTEDHIFKKNIDTDPEDFEQGGRVGLMAGKFVKLAQLLKDPKKVKQAIDNIFPTGDVKYDASMAAESLVELNPKIFGNKLYDDLDSMTQLDIYDAVISPMMSAQAKALKIKKATKPEKTLQSIKEGKGINMSDPKIAKEFEQFIKQTDPEGAKKLEQTLELDNFDPKGRKKNAIGGRIGYFMGGPNPRGLGLLKQILNYMSKKGIETGKFQGADLSGLDMLRLSNPKRFNKLLSDVRGKVNIKEGIMGTDTVQAQQLALREQRKVLTEKILDVAKAMKKDQDKIAKRIDEEAKKTIIPQVKRQLMEGMGMSEEAAEKTAKNMAEVAKNMKPLNAPPEIIDEGLLQLENVLKNLETGGKKKRELNATGGRIGLKDGMDRRTFMKIMAGLASIPVVGKVFKGAKVASKAAPVVKEAVTSGGTPPPYFFNLVKKIKNLGDDVTETRSVSEREKVTAYKDYELTEDLTTGETTIQRIKIDGDNPTRYDEVLAEETYMNYKPGKGQADETTGKVADEYTEDTSYIGKKGTVYDTVDGVGDEVIQEGTVSADNVAEFITKEAQSIKKAGGGIARMLGE